MFGDKEFGKNAGYPTPEETPEDTTCLTLQIPANSAWWAIYTGLLSTLAEEGVWQQFEGGMSREDAAAEAFAIFNDAMARADSENCALDVPAPYWDDNEDVDAELPVDAQPWYGVVSDPEAPPDELDFVENAAIWIFTGFLAVATWEIGAAPAVLFHTIAPKFVLATRRGDVGEIIRILVDGEEAARVDTSSASVGDVIETPIVPEASESGHDIMIVQVS